MMNDKEHLRKQELLEAYKDRLHQRQLQFAKYGLSADPSIITEIKEIEDAISKLENDLGGTEEKESNNPILHLKFLDQGDYYDNLWITQSPTLEPYYFALSLHNIAEGSVPAEKIDIKLEFFWSGPDISYQPQFITYIVNRNGLGWQEQRSMLKSDKPALWLYHGDSNDRCAFGFPRNWLGFAVRLKEIVDGKFELHYQIASTSPYTHNTGMLIMNMLQPGNSRRR